MEAPNDSLIDDIFNKTEDTITSHGIEFKEYTFVPTDFIGFSYMWYGSTGSGKSYHIRSCLNLVKHYFSRVVLFSPTNAVSGDFTGIINDAMIIPELTEDKFIQCIDTQKAIADLYRTTVNNIPNLSKLFMLCAEPHEVEKYKTIINARESEISIINSSGEPVNITTQKIEELDKQLNEKLILFFKYTIIPKRDKIDINGLSPNEIECLRNIDMNPRTLFIFDDVQEELKLLSRGKGKSALQYKNLFTKGRHYFFTNWFTFQDEASPLPQVRNSAKISIFADSVSAKKFIDRSTNGVDKEAQKLAAELISNLYRGRDDHRKVLYFRERSGLEKFQFHIAPNPGSFKVGSAVVNNFCSQVLKK